jgi:hypothetical protein
MRVHSNLVGSVPGKSQTNNSGSDKREHYTITQALQKSAPHYKRAWRHIFAIELYMLREEGEVPIPSCIEVVNSLRNAPNGIFEEWKQLVTAALFKDHGYKNKKQSSGYWF